MSDVGQFSFVTSFHSLYQAPVFLEDGLFFKSSFYLSTFANVVNLLVHPSFSLYFFIFISPTGRKEGLQELFVAFFWGFLQVWNLRFSG